MIGDRVEFQFDGWRDDRGRMASIELAIMERVGFLSLDPTTSTNRIYRKEPLNPFSTGNVRAVLAILKNFKLEPTLDDSVRKMLGEVSA